jgi:hypothetical protein
MNSVTDCINKINELGATKQELIKQIQSIDEEIKDAVRDWQRLCDHPTQYRSAEKCTACGLAIEEMIDEPVSS